MRVGVPKEVKVHEYRVGLVPGSVRELVLHGHEVLVETGAGEVCGGGLACVMTAVEVADGEVPATLVATTVNV